MAITTTSTETIHGASGSRDGQRFVGLLVAHVLELFAQRSLAPGALRARRV